MRSYHKQGLCLDPKNLQMSPKLLARLAHSVAGKADVRKVVGQLLPDLCQVRPPPAACASLPCFAIRAAARARDDAIEGG